MSVVKLDVDDLDNNRMIENEIRHTLFHNASAKIDTAVITRLYRLPSDGDPPTSTLKDRCDAIAKIFDVETIMADDLAVFFRKPEDHVEWP